MYILHEHAAWHEFLNNVKTLIVQRGKRPPCVFISYAWEDETTPEGRADNVRLQKRLLRLKEDLERVGMEVFLDITNMTGDIKETMRVEVARADFILPICTPRYKMRVQITATNAAFEYQTALAKRAVNSRNVIPLRFKEEFAHSVPTELGAALIRDFTHEDEVGYTQAMATLFDPIGLLAAIYDLRHGDEKYEVLLHRYRYRQLHNSLRPCEPFIERTAPLSLEPHWPRYFIQCLTGSSGVGKTQWARVYAAQQRAADPECIVHWISGDATKIADAFRACAQSLGERVNDVPAQDIVRSVYRNLAHIPNCLLIMDEVTDWHSIELYLPRERIGALRILLTSCNAHWSAPSSAQWVKTHEVPSFNDAEALAYLQAALPRAIRDEEALPLVQDFGAHPLALAHAVRYLLNNPHVTVTRFRQRFVEHGLQLLSLGIPPGAQPTAPVDPLRSVRRGFTVYLDELAHSAAPAARLALELISCVAYLDPNEILSEQLRELMDCNHLELDAAIALLRGGSLLTSHPDEPEQLCCLRLVQYTVRERHALEQPVRFAHVAERLAQRMRQFSENDLSAREQMREWLPHCVALLAHRKLVAEHPSAALFTLANRVERYYMVTGDLNACEACLPQSLALARHHGEPIKLATTLTNHGRVLIKLKKWSQSKQALEEALEQYRRLAAAQPEQRTLLHGLIAVRNQLITWYKAQQQAIPLHHLQELLHHYQSLYGEAAHPDTALALYQLGRAHRTAAQWSEAKNYLERALAMYRAIHLDNAHPDIIGVLSHLGHTCEKLGAALDAKRYLKEALRLAKQVHGATHRDTLALRKLLEKMG
jgi:tetratricopeptide (TPR) repeat protein